MQKETIQEVIKRIVLRFFPELESGTHFPQLAVVMSIPDPPTSGEQFTDERHYYAVDVRLLKPSGEIDEDMPLMRDIPLSLPAAAPNRGIAGFPQPGTIVEIAFAFGMQSKPFIRSVLPYGLKLPAIDAESQRWQQSNTSYQETDKDGNWKRITDKNITDEAENINNTSQKTKHTSSTEHIIKSPQIYIGNETDNTLKIDSDHMQTIIEALQYIANHTHTGNLGASTSQPDNQGSITASATTIGGLKAKLDAIVKT